MIWRNESYNIMRTMDFLRIRTTKDLGNSYIERNMPTKERQENVRNFSKPEKEENF